MRAVESTAPGAAADAAGVQAGAVSRVTVRPLEIATMWSLHGNPLRGGLAPALARISGAQTLPGQHRMLRTPCGAWAAWTGPGSVLLIAGAGADLPCFDAARERLSGTGAVAFDVGDSRHAVVLEGPPGGALLAGGCPADLSDAAFPAGSVRSSLLGPLSCIVARPSAAAAWWAMVPRSYGTSLRDWLRGPWLDFDVVEADEAVSA